jgi:hypothetical protein
MAAERLSDLVGDLAEDLADKYLWMQCSLTHYIGGG